MTIYLHNDTWIQVLHFLPLPEIYSAKRINKFFDSLINSDFWQKYGMSQGFNQLINPEKIFKQLTLTHLQLLKTTVPNKEFLLPKNFPTTYCYDNNHLICGLNAGTLFSWNTTPQKESQYSGTPIEGDLITLPFDNHSGPITLLTQHNGCFYAFANDNGPPSWPLMQFWKNVPSDKGGTKIEWSFTYWGNSSFYNIISHYDNFLSSDEGNIYVDTNKNYRTQFSELLKIPTSSKTTRLVSFDSDTFASAHENGEIKIWFKNELKHTFSNKESTVCNLFKESCLLIAPMHDAVKHFCIAVYDIKQFSHLYSFHLEFQLVLTSLTLQKGDYTISSIGFSHGFVLLPKKDDYCVGFNIYTKTCLKTNFKASQILYFDNDQIIYKDHVNQKKINLFELTSRKNSNSN